MPYAAAIKKPSKYYAAHQKIKPDTPLVLCSGHGLQVCDNDANVKTFQK